MPGQEERRGQGHATGTRPEDARPVEARGRGRREQDAAATTSTGCS